MAFTASISVNLDAVNETTIVNATGEVLRELGKKIFAAVSRLRQHVVRAQQALSDAHTAPPHIQQSLGVEVTTARQRFDRLVGLLVLVHDKVKDEQAAQQRARRRMPAAIDWLSNDEWDVISVMGSVFDDDIPSLAETGSESTSQRPGDLDTDDLNSSFDLIDFGEDDFQARSDCSTEDERRANTPHASASPSSASAPPSSAQAHEFGPSSRTTSRPNPNSNAPPSQQNTSVPPGWEHPAATPWSAGGPPSSAAPSSSATAAPSSSATSSSTAPSSLSAPPSSAATTLLGQAAPRTESRSVPSSSAVPSSSSSSSSTSPDATFAAAVYDADYNNAIYGYVGGVPVPVVPEDLRILSPEQLRALRDEAGRRLDVAKASLGRASMLLHGLRGSQSANDEDIVALVIDFSAREEDVAKANRLRRVALYEELHRYEASGEFVAEREAQRQLIAAESLRLAAGGTPIFWCQADQDEARRVQRGCRGYSTWSPAAPPASAPRRAPTPSSSATSHARARSRVTFAQSPSRRGPWSPTPARRIAQPSSPPARDPWVPRDSSELAVHQFRERIDRMDLQRDGDYKEIKPNPVVHLSPFNGHQNKATLQALMRNNGFDLDDATRIVDYHVTCSRKGNDFHHYGFVTFKYLDAAKRCVHELDRMDVDRHRGMTPIVERDDGYAAHAVLTFSFSKPNKDKLNKARRQLNVGGYGRSSSRSRPALRRHCRPPVYDSDSDETGLE